MNIGLVLYSVSDRQSLIDVLKKYDNNNIIVFETAQKAADYLSNNDVDVLILDISIDKDLLSILELVRKNSSSKKIIVLSSVDEDDVTYRLFDMGVDFVITKPYDEEKIVKEVFVLDKNGNLQNKSLDSDFQFKNIEEGIHKLLK